MNRRRFLKYTSVAGVAGLAGCGGSSSSGEKEENATSTVPEELEEARDEYNESQKEQANQDTATPEPEAEPLNWINWGRNGQDNRFVPSQTFSSGEYTTKWSTGVGTSEDGAQEVITGGGRLYVLKRNVIAAYDGTGERVWLGQDPAIDNLGYANERIAATTNKGGIFVANAESGDRESLLTDVGEGPVATQMTAEGYYSVLYEDPELHLSVVDVTAGELVLNEPLTDMRDYTEQMLADGEQVYVIGADRNDSSQEYPMRMEVWNASGGKRENGFTTTWLTDNSMEQFEDATMIEGQIFALMGAYDFRGNAEAMGLLSFSTDGTLNWSIEQIADHTNVKAIFTDGSRVYVVTKDQIRAYSAADGSQAWQYTTRQRFAPDAGLLSNDFLMIPDQGGVEGIRVHNIDTDSGEASRTQLYSVPDDQQPTFADAPVHIRPANSGLYTMGLQLRHLSASDG